jgi:hypothetical protein
MEFDENKFLNKFVQITAELDLIIGIAFLVLAALRFSFRLAGFLPSGVVFSVLGAVLVMIFWVAGWRGYPPPSQMITSYATLQISKEQVVSNPELRVTIKGGSLSFDQVHIFLDGKEVVSSRWTFGRKREYDLNLGGKKMKIKLRRGLDGPRYDLHSDDGTLLSEDIFESESESSSR